MPTGNDGNQNTEQKDQSNGGAGNEQSNQPQDFEAWLEAQPDEVKVAYEKHVTGLKNTVTATRTERDNYKKDLSVLLKKAEKGSETEAQLQEALGKIEAAERKANFMEDALRPEIGCKNPRTAFALATAEDLFTKQGIPDWAAIKSAAPELFQAYNPKGNAGSGTTEKTNVIDMNTAIRQKAGVQ